MSTSNKDIASLVVSFLNSAVANSAVPEDNRESIEFAVESITDAFSLDQDSIDSVKAKYNNKSLSELISIPTKSESNESGFKKETVPVHIDTADAATKDKAEALKLEGNKAMAAKNFEEAVAKYSAAIELIPTNAVYLSNRAAAYSSMRKHDLALTDAEKATEVEPTYGKGWSRLGLAKYALGDAEGSMKAYEKGLQVEGNVPSDAMKRGYETAKKRVGDNLMKSLNGALNGESDGSDLPTPVAATAAMGGDGSNPAGASAGGLPDFSAFANMMGGGDSGVGGLAGLMNNPDIMQAATKMMQDPNALQNLMSNPQVKQMASSMGIGGDNLDNILNNPMLANMAKSFMGGQQGANDANNNDSN